MTEVVNGSDVDQPGKAIDLVSWITLIFEVWVEGKDFVVAAVV